MQLARGWPSFKVAPTAVVCRGRVILCNKGEGLRWHFEAQEEVPDEVPPREGTCRNCLEFSLQRDVGWLADNVSHSQAGRPGSSI